MTYPEVAVHQPGTSAAGVGDMIREALYRTLHGGEDAQG